MRMTMSNTHEASMFKVKPEHIRAALMSAVGKGIKFPSIELEECVAKYLNSIKEIGRV